MKFILASNNHKKLAELKAILSQMGHEILSQSEAGLNLEVEETGSTFRENALLKARAACEAGGLPAISDDSGLVVEALNGEPGVYSARYGGKECVTDAQRYELLLKNMEGIENRSAKFVSSIACVFPEGDTVCAEGECEGAILESPRGEGGFGYDPVFYLPEYRQTMSEIGQEQKNKISHRAKALEAFRKELEIYVNK